MAVSWVWHPGAPYGRWIHKLRSESASTFPSLLGLYGPSMRIRMRQVGHRPAGCVDCLLAIRAVMCKSDEFRGWRCRSTKMLVKIQRKTEAARKDLSSSCKEIAQAQTKRYTGLHLGGNGTSKH